MYQIVFILLVFYSLIEIHNNKRHSKVFSLLYALMTVIVTFRYGQHADYFAYLMYYDNPVLSARDPGFMAIIMLFKWLGVSNIAFSAIISFLTMVLIYPFFNQTCRKSIVALLVFWSYCYTTCSMSAIRQGLALGVVLSCYAYYPRIKTRKTWIIYLLFVLLISTIHMSALVALFFPMVSKIHLREYKVVGTLAVIVGCLLTLITSTFVEGLLPSFVQNRVYSADNESKLFQLILRLSIILCVLLITHSKKGDNDIESAKKIIIFGFVLYGLFSFSGTTAGRIEYYSRMFVCLIVGVTSASKIRTDKIVVGLTLLVVIHSALWIRNIDVEIRRAHYRQGITVTNIPFITIFNKDDFYLNTQGISDHDIIINNIDW